MGEEGGTNLHARCWTYRLADNSQD